MYFMCVAADSVESQRRGLILLFYPSPDSMGSDGDSMFKTLPSLYDRKLANRFNVAIPIRICAVHLCLPDTLFFRLFRSIMVLSFQSSAKLRLKTHTGTLHNHNHGCVCIAYKIIQYIYIYIYIHYSHSLHLFYCGLQHFLVCAI